jgi:hypothetical protein
MADLLGLGTIIKWGVIALLVIVFLPTIIGGQFLLWDILSLLKTPALGNTVPIWMVLIGAIVLFKLFSGGGSEQAYQ